MKRRVTFSVITLVAVALIAQAAAGQRPPNCVNFLTGQTAGAERDYLCTVRSDFAPAPFTDCFTFVRVSRDRFNMNVFGLTPFFAPGACDQEGSLANPRFGRSMDWKAQFTYPFNSPLTIVFDGFDMIDGARFYGEAINEGGNRFYYRCKRDVKNQCPLVTASPVNWSRRSR